MYITYNTIKVWDEWEYNIGEQTEATAMQNLCQSSARSPNATARAISEIASATGRTVPAALQPSEVQHSMMFVENRPYRLIFVLQSAIVVQPRDVYHVFCW